MTKDVEKLRQIAIDVAKSWDAGAIGFTPDYDFEQGKNVPSVHLVNGLFCHLFDKADKIEDFYLDGVPMKRLIVKVDGVRFYTVVEKEVA